MGLHVRLSYKAGIERGSCNVTHMPCQRRRRHTLTVLVNVRLALTLAPTFYMCCPPFLLSSRVSDDHWTDIRQNTLAYSIWCSAVVVCNMTLSRYRRGPEQVRRDRRNMIASGNSSHPAYDVFSSDRCSIHSVRSNNGIHAYITRLSGSYVIFQRSLGHRGIEEI